MNKFKEKCVLFGGRKRRILAALASMALLAGAVPAAGERLPERDRKIKERRQAAARREAERSALETAPALRESARLPTEEVKVGDSRISDAASNASPEGPQEMKLERVRAKYPR